AAVLAASMPALASTVVIESWENTLDGWTVPPAYNAEPYTSSFSTVLGVTDGSYSLAVSGTAGPNYGQLLAGPSSTGLTSILGNATSLSLDIYTPPGSFGYFLQFDIDINNADTGFVSLDGYSYPSTTIGSESTITVPISSSLAATLASSSNPTAIFIQVGGGYTDGNETMYLDNLRADVTVPDPASAASGIVLVAGLGVSRLSRSRRK
ncbi:MAG TPA: hypothetical protein VG722_11135, partial [Tepidisphaeraceae bacterium]|nr:hypothetical protein [Tepidisphaeraceae bacterium]